MARPSPGGMQDSQNKEAASRGRGDILVRSCAGRKRLGIPGVAESSRRSHTLLRFGNISPIPRYRTGKPPRSRAGLFPVSAWRGAAEPQPHWPQRARPPPSRPLSLSPGGRMRPLLCCLGIAALLGRSLACPSACSCSAKKNGRLLAECAYKELLEVPRGLSPNVSILTLSANRIGWLRRGAFAEVPEVQSLWLGYNQIGAVEPGAFALLAQLKNLDLSHNKITDFPWQDLRNLSGLQILKMNNNRLAGLPRDAFHALKDLRSLWLNDNQLTTLAEGTFDKLPSLSQLQIFNNPFNCSCKVFWLKRWTESTSVSITKGGATLCVAPGRLKGRAVTDIPEHHCVAPSVQLTYLSNLDNSVTYDGLTLTLHCSVAGSPPPEIRWKIQTSSRGVEINGPTVARDGNAKQSQERFLVFKNGTMAIPRFSKEDEGIYTCLAVNDVGTREVSVNVALAGSENPAEDLLQDDPQASQLGGQSCYKGDEMDPSGAGEKLVIVYHMPRESKSKAGGAVPHVQLGTLLLALGIALSW